MTGKKIFALTLLAGTIMASSCVSKKDLESCQADLRNCQTENKSLTSDYMNVKEQLAAAQARVSSLTDQLAQQKQAYAALQGSLDKSLANTSANNIKIGRASCRERV